MAVRLNGRRPARYHASPMGVTIADGLLEHLRGSSGSQSLQLRGAPDPEAAARGMRAARRALYTIPHPEEPSEPAPSFASGVEDAGGGPQFWFDISDAEAYPGLLEKVLDIVVAARTSSGVETDTLTWPEDER
jgi:hypothetical protein